MTRYVISFNELRMSDVEKVGSRRAQRTPVRDRGLGVEIASAVAEGVGRDVDDAHHEGHVNDPFR